MSASVINRNVVLVLNKNWQPIDVTTPAEAFCQMVTDVATALDIQGKDHLVPTRWKDWVNLSVREEDFSVGTPHGQVRVPTVIVLSKFSKMPIKRPKLTKQSLWERDKGTCQYTGKPLTPETANIDHIQPKSRGGASSWENLVIVDRTVNTRKANKTPSEAGLQLLKTPTRPAPVPAMAMIRNAHNVPDWELFGISSDKS